MRTAGLLDPAIRLAALAVASLYNCGISIYVGSKLDGAAQGGIEICVKEYALFGQTEYASTCCVA